MSENKKIEMKQTRRSFLTKTAAGAAGLAIGSITGGGAARRAFSAPPEGETVVTESFASVIKLADGAWAIASTPTGGAQTICNGGIIAGRDGVMVLEAFNTIGGAAWASGVAEQLTGRRPTHVVLTHYHGDHSNGLAGYQRGADPITIISTVKTRELIRDRNGVTPSGKVEGSPTLATGSKVLLPDTVITDTSRPTEIDLGGRTVQLLPRSGHTPSDVAVRIDGLPILWTGDLVFLSLFPNYMDAIPTQLRKSCDELLGDRDVTYVPGHGPLSDADGLKRYLGLLDSVEEAARAAIEKGMSATDAQAQYEIPESLGQWTLFRPNLVRDAFIAWEKDLKA